MRYDIKLAHDYCSESGLSAVIRDGDRLDVTLADDVVLCLLNNDDDENCLIGFEDTPWHFHNNLVCGDGQGYSIELDYLDVLQGRTDGTVLICEVRSDDRLTDRYLVHKKYNDEFGYMKPGEEFRIFRADLIE